MGRLFVSADAVAQLSSQMRSEIAAPASIRRLRQCSTAVKASFLHVLFFVAPLPSRALLTCPLAVLQPLGDASCDQTLSCLIK